MRDENEPIFQDRPVIWEAVLAVAAVLAYTTWQHVQDPTPQSLRALLLGNAVLPVTLGVLWTLRRGMGPRWVRVSQEGLRVGRWTLPAGEVGTVERLDAAAARATGTRARYGDRRIHLSTANRLTSSLEGFAIEDLRHDEPRVWIVTTRHPDELHAALDQITRAARATQRKRR